LQIIENFFLETCHLNRQVKWSGGRALKLKTPVALLVPIAVSFVDKFLSVRVAPGTTAPAGSVTMPLIEGFFHTFGAAGSWLWIVPGQDTSLQYLEAGSAVHLSLDHLEPVNVAFDGTIAPPRRDGKLNRFQVPPQRRCKLR
jgi:hypothetical protein